jgi:hypothetical protein
MDAAIPVDAKNAPTGIWKTAQNAVSRERPHPSSLVHEEERRKTNATLINLSTDSDQVQMVTQTALNRTENVGGQLV